MHGVQSIAVRRLSRAMHGETWAHRQPAFGMVSQGCESAAERLQLLEAALAARRRFVVERQQQPLESAPQFQNLGASRDPASSISQLYVKVAASQITKKQQPCQQRQLEADLQTSRKPRLLVLTFVGRYRKISGQMRVNRESAGSRS